jgi:hypothetical protein
MHNIKDIRLFWQNDIEFLSQFPSTPYAIPGDEDDKAGKLIEDSLFSSEQSSIESSYKLLTEE